MYDEAGGGPGSIAAAGDDVGARELERSSPGKVRVLGFGGASGPFVELIGGGALGGGGGGGSPELWGAGLALGGAGEGRPWSGAWYA